jgi:WD40 repeat protein
MAVSKDGQPRRCRQRRPAAIGDGDCFGRQGGATVTRFTDPQDLVYSLAFSPDGKWLAAASADKAVYVWDLSGRQIGESP